MVVSCTGDQTATTWTGTTSSTCDWTAPPVKKSKWTVYTSTLPDPASPTAGTNAVVDGPSVTVSYTAPASDPQPTDWTFETPVQPVGPCSDFVMLNLC